MTLQLPFKPPLAPMLAKLASSLPAGEGWIYEPKWDGFRAIVFKNGDDVYLQSRDLKPLGRYFPELVQTLRENLPERCVLDGEIVIATDGRLDFDALLLRIHPAASRVKTLSEQSPSSFVAWDLLAIDDKDLRESPQHERRSRLERALADVKPPIHVTPITRDFGTAADWFNRFEGAGLDGVMAKPEGLAYLAGKRAMMKVKHQRTAECVVAGFRWYKGGKNTLVGSLLLGLYDHEGTLHHVGVCSAFKAEVRAQLTEKFAPYREGARESHPWTDWANFAAEPDVPTQPGRIQHTGTMAIPSFGEGEEAALAAEVAAEQSEPQRKPGATSRWNRGKDLTWEPLRIELVCEVSYDHLQGSRFRHATHFQRWRPDKPPSDCRYDQLEETPPFLVAEIFGA